MPILLLVSTALAATFEVQVARLPTGSTVPVAHTCDGANRAPDVRWAPGPSPTRTYALIVDDPDAPVGTWVHWLAWNMPITSTEIYEGTKSNDRGLTQGLNDFHQVGWGGPCPPKNNGAHRYGFRMYALDTILPLESGASRTALEAAMNGHILATGEWVGTYERRP